MTLLMVAFATMAHAQTAANILTVSDLKVQAGRSARLPIALENPDEVVAMQFDVVLPANITNSTGGVALSERAKGSHNITGRMMDSSTCRVVVISNNNNAIKGNAGDIVYVDMNIPASLTDKDTCQVQIKNIVLSDINGNDLPVATSIGKITVARMPDLAISNLKVSTDKINPGDNVNLEWTVTNTGELPTTGGWTEQISLVGIDGGSKYISTLSQSQTLDSGASMERRSTLAIPDVPTLDGEVLFVVKIVPDANNGEPASALNNNEMMTINTVLLSKRLYFNIVTDIEENHYHPYGLSGSVTRSGDRSESETFTINLTPTDDRVSLPVSVSIPAGESSKYFNYYISDNSTLDNDSVFIVTLSGSDYENVVRTLKVHDNELPKLAISLDKSEVKEGESFSITVTAERAPLEDLKVNLTSNNQSRFNIPSTVTIPAGQLTVSTEGSAIDNEDPQLDETFKLRTSAPLYSSQWAEIRIMDNDIPAIALAVTPSVFGEGNDSTEIKAILSRTTNIDKRVRVNLSVNRNGHLSFERQVMMESGIDMVEIPIKPIDNGTVDYSRDITLTAQVYLAANNENAPSNTSGYATADVRVLDDDGLTLTVTPDRSVWVEGSSNYLYISRNTTSVEGAVTVTLSANDDSRFDFDKTVTIPAGSVSTRVPVSVKRNTVDGDDFDAMFTASAPDYNEGICMLVISDSSLADAEVTLSLSDSNVEIQSAFTAEATVTNNGYLTLPLGTEVNVYSRGELVATEKIPSDLNPGDNTVLSFPLVAPEDVKTTEYYAIVNEGRAVKEMSYSNNRSKTVYLSTTPGFTTELTVDKALYKPGETVVINGKAIGNHAADAPVRVMVKGAGNFTHYIDVECDNMGNFYAEWTPYNGQAGHFSFTSSHPNIANNEEQAGVDLYGLQLRSVNGKKFMIEEENSDSFDIKVYNPGPKLTGIKAEILTAPANCNIDLNNASIESLATNETATIPMRITGLRPSASEAFDSIYVRIFSNETPEVATLHWVNCRSHKAYLSVTPSIVDLTLVKGKERQIQVDITNMGLRESGDVNWTARQWVKSVSPIAPIQPGETVTATVTLEAIEDCMLDVPYSGSQISFVCANGNGASVKLNVSVVSEDKGSLVITASDDNTYNSNDHKHLANAEVKVSHSYSGREIFSGVTDANGKFVVDSITEGYYDVYVTAPRHYSFSKQRLLINPGVVNELEAMLFLDTSTGRFEPDNPSNPSQGEVVIEPTIYVDDAAPSLVVSLPTDRPALNMIMPVTVTNHGTVAVGRTSMTFSVPEGFEMEIIDKPFLNIIAPKSKATFYALLRATAEDADPSAINFVYGATVHAQYNCGPYTKVIDQTAKRAWGPDAVSSLLGDDNNDNNPSDGNEGTSQSLPSANRFGIDGINNFVSLQLSRTSVMSKQNLSAYFVVDNRSLQQIADLWFDFKILDAENNSIEDGDVFNVSLQSLEGFNGSASADTKWTLSSSAKGVATFTLTPSLEAAFNQPARYSIGGAMYYTDPVNGGTAKVNIMPIPLYVNPMAKLDLTYFLQRDIYGDDLSTPDITEPSIPAELSLLIANNGNGPAPNVTLVMPKPEVRNNSTNLPIDFRFVGSQLNGSPVTANTGRDITTRISNIPSGTNAYVQWWMECNQTGHFTEYNMINTKFGSTDIDDSVIGDVSLHELIRSIIIDNSGDVPLKGFLVNDIEDDYDLPDHIYLTDNTVEEVYEISEAKITNASGTEYSIQVTPSQNGWNYGIINDPTNGRQKIESIKCITDGKDIDVQNFWQTDRIMLDGAASIRGNRIHFADMFGNDSRTYKLTFSYVPDKSLDVAKFEGLSTSSVEDTQISRIKVIFNKAINANTFTKEAIALTCQGQELDVDQLILSKISDQEFIIDLAACTSSNGCYILSIDTRKMVDAEGFTGSEIRFAEWLQYLNGKVALVVNAEPKIGGTVSPQSDDYEYGTNVTLKAEAADGYMFSHWTHDGELLSDKQEVTVAMVDSASYTAHFQPLKYFVEILHEGGELDGPGTGYYGLGEKLDMKVKAMSGWFFDGWKVNGEGQGTSKQFTFTVDGDNLIEAYFTCRKSDISIDLPAGWSWITPTLTDLKYFSPEGFLEDIADHVICMRNIDSEIINDPELGLVGTINHLEPTNSYKINMGEPAELRHYGRIALNNEIRLYLSEGWTWLGYVPTVPMDLSTAFSDFVPEENDLVKSKISFATYVDGKWVGNLVTLDPNQGYMYFSGKSKSFHYPNNHMGLNDQKRMSMSPVSNIWNIDVNRYSDNATVIAVLEDNTLSDSLTLGAFVGKECRGIGQWIDGRCFITVQGDSNDGFVTFRAYNNITGEEVEITEGFNFETGIVGTFDDPLKLHLNGTSGIPTSDVNDSTWEICPNPVKTTLYITGDANAIEAVSVISVSGNVVISQREYDVDGGLNVSSLVGGHYILAIKTKKGIVYRRFIKLN